MADELKDTNPELFKDLGINPNELPADLQKIYKSMQADYTRKTQTLAEAKKEWSTKEQDFMNKVQNLGALEQEVTQWREWYKSLEDDKQTEDEHAKSAEEKLLREQVSKGEPDANARMIEKLESNISELQNKLLTYERAITDSSKRVDRMFNYHAQLAELTSKYPKLDKQKLLDHALKSGQTDLDKAYRELYYDDIVQEEVDKRLKEELAKVRTDGIHTSSRPVIVRRSDKPLSWEEATDAIVRERAVQGKLE